jgi:hypothetical protein
VARWWTICTLDFKLLGDTHIPAALTAAARAASSDGLVGGEVGYSQQDFLGGTAMPVTVKSISLWRQEAENKTGLLAQTLAPLAKAGADLGVVMGYRLPGDGARAVIEVYPVAGKKVTEAAIESGLAASSIPTLLVEGDNKPGLAHKIAQAIADAGTDLSFFVAQAIGRKYSAVIGFANEDDAKKAATLIKKTATNKK